jgi:hypothetical protein
MRNRRDQQMHPNRLRNLILWTGVIIALLLPLLLWDETWNLIKNSQPNKTAGQEHWQVGDVNIPVFTMPHLAEEQKGGESSRQVYPYSVVDGGVHSVQELRSAIGRDPVVAKHYSNFKLDRATVIEAKAEGNFHVSYRMGDGIFWTEKRLKVAKGERLITDGTHFTRTRCANLLSEAPKGITSPHEPAAEVFDTPSSPPSIPSPFMPPVIIAGGPPGLPGGGGDGDPGGEGVFPNPGSGPGSDPGSGAPGSGRPGSGDPGFLPGPFSGPIPGPSSDPVLDPGVNPAPDPVPVPEPTTMLLLASGLAGLWGFRKKLKK